eukprot:c13012_g1_i1.p1 GENE.c13012_g1_i1~~c13012_g1_i1.p1  ORF type:complete len:229 (+),score=73.51 c13012_g1_i1:146-832(+)
MGAGLNTMCATAFLAFVVLGAIGAVLVHVVMVSPVTQALDFTTMTDCLIFNKTIQSEKLCTSIRGSKSCDVAYRCALEVRYIDALGTEHTGVAYDSINRQHLIGNKPVRFCNKFSINQTTPCLYKPKPHTNSSLVFVNIDEANNVRLYYVIPALFLLLALLVAVSWCVCYAIDRHNTSTNATITPFTHPVPSTYAPLNSPSSVPVRVAQSSKSRVAQSSKSRVVAVVS